jgi:hypothetical protein
MASRAAWHSPSTISFTASCGGGVRFRDFRLTVTEDSKREAGNHLLGNPRARFDGIFGPDRRARRKNFDEREARSIALQF